MIVSKCMTFGIINHFLLENLSLMHSFFGSRTKTRSLYRNERGIEGIQFKIFHRVRLCKNEPIDQ
jgi:hypothetical protein